MPKTIRAVAAVSKSAFHLEADVEILAAAAEQKGPREFSVKAYTGGEVRVAKYDLPIVIDLAGMTNAKDIKANLDHDPTKRVGHITAVSNDGRAVQLRGLVSATGPSAKEFQSDHDNGYPWKASVEVRPTKLQEVAAGQKVEVNGRTFTGPIYVARKSTLFGTAFLARGADEDTTVTIAAAAADSEKKGKIMKFEEWVLAMSFDVETLSDKQKAALQVKYDAEIKAAAVDTPVEGAKAPIIAAPEFDLDEVKAAASEHLAEVEGALAEHEPEIRDGKKFAEIKAGAIKEARALKAKAIKERWPATRLEVEAIRHAGKVELALIRAEAPAGPAIHSRARDTSPQVIEAALCLQRKMPDVEKQFDEKTLQAAHTQYRNIGLQEFLIMAAAENGYQTRPGEHIHQGNLRTILAHALPEIHADSSTGAPGASSLTSGILGNIANKELLIGYMQEDQSWGEIAARKSVKDFKQVTSFRLLDDMRYEKLGPGGEIKHGAINQESYTRQANTYAKLFALTRTDIINDDLGAFDDLRNRIGLGAARAFSDIFWGTFLNALATFFTAGRGNYISGATTNLLTDGVGLQLGITAFRKLRSPTVEGAGGKRLGTTIGGRPEILLVPPESEFNAGRLYQSTNIVSGATAGMPDANIHANKYRPVICPWLSDTNFNANASATFWFLLRKPTLYPAVVASFLNGVELPTVESTVADFDVLGVQFRGYHDFGVDMAEYVCGIMSKGAA